MLKKLSCLAVIATLSSMPALANTEGFYVGGQLSTTKLKENASSYSDSTNFTVLSGLVGFQFNPYFAVEGRYGQGISDQSASEDGDIVTTKVSRQTAILAKGIVPINDVFSMYGVAGLGAVKFTRQESINNVSLSYSETLDGFTAGVGAAFNLSPQLALTLEYLQFPDKNFAGDNFKLKTNSVTVGVNYAF